MVCFLHNPGGRQAKRVLSSDKGLKVNIKPESGKLKQRVVSALVMAPCFIAILYAGGPILQVFLILAFALSLYEWYGLSRRTERFLFYFSIGTAYMTMAYGSFYFLREIYNLNILLIFIGMIWFSDIGAYFTGKTLGGPKLIQKISPNKTWSGFGGALFFPAVFTVIWISLFGFHEHFQKISLLMLLPLGFTIGLAVGCVGQVGDLLVSYVKRRANVKDTGTIIPGHGGLLDRIDSMMLGAPVYLFLISVLYYVF